MSRNVSIGLIAAGVIAIATLEHFLGLALHVLLPPHLAIILSVVAVILLGAGAYGLTSGSKSQAS